MAWMSDAVAVSNNCPIITSTPSRPARPQSMAVWTRHGAVVYELMGGKVLSVSGGLIMLVGS